MKRLLLIATFFMASVLLVPCAQANVVTDPGFYKIKFDGFEYAYWGSHTDFMSGDIADADMVKNYTQLITPDRKGLATGFSLSAMLYCTTINSVNPVTQEVEYPALYGDPDHAVPSVGSYIAILRDMTVVDSSGAPASGSITFSGGAIDWYFVPTMVISDVSKLVYVAGQGLVNSVTNQLFDVASLGAAFATFDIFDDNGAANTAINFDAFGRLTGQPHLYADTTNPLFDSNFFGDAHDMFMHATLTWMEHLGRFEVNDPAYVKVPTPEPGSFVLMALGLLLTVCFIGYRRKSI